MRSVQYKHLPQTEKKECNYAGKNEEQKKRMKAKGWGIAD
jgi:hypothetical protein